MKKIFSLIVLMVLASLAFADKYDSSSYKQVFKKIASDAEYIKKFQDEIKDKDFIIKAYLANVESLDYIPRITDKQLALELISMKKHLWKRLLPYFSKELRTDKEVILEALKRHGGEMRYLDEKYRDNKEMMMLCVKQPENNYYPEYHLNYASERLKKDRELVMEALKVYGPSLKVVPHFADDREIVTVAIKQVGYSILYASERLKNDKELVLLSFENTGVHFDELPERMKNDREVALKAIKASYENLKHLSDKFKDDKEIALLAFDHSSATLREVSERLKDDKDVALKAVRADGANIKYVSDRLKDDKEIIIAGVKDEGLYAYRMASERLKRDIDVIAYMAIKYYGEIKELPKDLANKEFYSKLNQRIETIKQNQLKGKEK